MSSEFKESIPYQIGCILRLKWQVGQDKPTERIRTK